MAKGLMLENGSEVELVEEADRIIIRPKKNLRLDDLLAAINEMNLHGEIDAKGPRGNEAW